MSRRVIDRMAPAGEKEFGSDPRGACHEGEIDGNENP